MDLNEATKMGTALMKEHGLIRDGWRGKWDESLSRAGSCHYNEKVIYLSAPWVKSASEEDTRQTILHEIAHALAGYNAAHGPIWKATAAKIGYTGKRTISSQPDLSLYKYRGTCSGCGYECGRQRNTKAMKQGQFICGLCKAKINWRAQW